VIATSHSQRRDATYELLGMWLGMWRDALYLRVALPDQIRFPEVTDRLEAWSRGFDVASLHQGVTSTQRCMQDLDANVQARIALQAMVTQWPE
jgi:hypothetical protein